MTYGSDMAHGRGFVPLGRLWALDNRRYCLMLWYVALVAIVNLLLGYGLAVLTGARRTSAATAGGSIDTHTTEVAPPKSETFELVSTPASITPPEAIAAAGSQVRLPSREHAQGLLAEITRPSAGKTPVTVGLLELDDVDELERSIDERLLEGVANTIQGLLSDLGSVARFGNQQLLLTLPQDATHDATKRAEQVRQHIQATQFVADGQSIKTTVTCALVEVVDQPVLQLLECLEETLAEAKRCGGNRTFLHNGTAPSPVIPQEIGFASLQTTI